MAKNKEVADILNRFPLNKNQTIQAVIKELTNHAKLVIPDESSLKNDILLSLLFIHLGATLPIETQKQLMKSKDSIGFLNYVEKCLKKVDSATWNKFAELSKNIKKTEPEQQPEKSKRTARHS